MPTFSSANAETTTVNTSRWFAEPDSPYIRDTGTECTYTFDVKLTFGGKDFSASTSGNQKDSNVKVTYSGKVHIFPIWVGNPATGTTASGKWEVTGMGSLVRRSSFPKTVNTPSASQFYDKVDAHEDRHVDQFSGISPWVDMWNVNHLYTSRLATIPPQDTEQALETMITSTISNWEWHQDNWYLSKQCDMEWDAAQVGNSTGPQYLNYRKSDVPLFWGCSF